MRLVPLFLIALFLTSCATRELHIDEDLVSVEEVAAYGWPDPERFRDAIETFLADDAVTLREPGAIVATGSSSMRGWHKSIDEDLGPLTIIPRGFGGSDMYDVLYFVDELILRHEPRAVLLYEGDNDIAAGLPPQAVHDAFVALKQRVHAELPDTRFYVLAIKPSPSRWKHWPAMQEANVLLREAADRDPRVTYIDVATPMLLPDGTPKPDIYLGDNLHMNRAGYDIWTETVRPVLMAEELKYE